MSDNKENLFNEAFGDLINESSKTKKSFADTSKTNADPFDLIEEFQSGESMEKKWEEEMATYIPSHIGDADFEAHFSEPPLPPLSREEEFSACNLGLQELRRTRNYVKERHESINAELVKAYVTYPLLLERDFIEAVDLFHKKFFDLIEDMEHLVSGDIDKMSHVGSDLFHEFEQRRLKLLHEIRAYYHGKK